MQGAPPALLSLPLWCEGWQALFAYSCGLWVRSGEGCLGGGLQGGGLETKFRIYTSNLRSIHYTDLSLKPSISYDLAQIIIK